MSCPTGKNSYDTAFLAETALIDLHVRRNFLPDQGPQDVYECEFCGGWHLTSKSTTRNDQLQKMMDSGELRRRQDAQFWE